MTEKKNRNEMYREPPKFVTDYMYESQMLNDMQQEHWKDFDEKVNANKEWMVGDFINNSTRISANQIAKIVEKFVEMKSIAQVRAEGRMILDEIYRDIKE